MNDDSADLDRLFARLSGDGHAQNPDAHPTPEELSAYLANELSPQADDAIQEHLTQCTLCAGLLLDLQRLLDPPPEDLPREGVADLETEVEWRELRGKLRATQAPGTAPDTDEARKAPPRKILRSQAVAAVLALLLVGAVFRIVVLDRQLASPVAVQITTIEAQESKKGRPSEPTPFHLGNVAVFETHLEQPHRKLRLSFKDKNGRILRTLDAQEDENGMVALLLPSRFLALGLYRVEVREAESSASQSPRKFDIRILQ